MLNPVWLQLMHPFAVPLDVEPQKPAAPAPLAPPPTPEAQAGRSLLGRVLKAYRQEHGLTQEQLAEMLSVEPRTLRAWENERPTGNIHELYRIAEVLGVESERLGEASAAFHTPLRYQRRLRGWSQARVAEAIGADPTMVSRWECGARKPSPYYQEQLYRLFATTADQLGFL